MRYTFLKLCFLSLLLPACGTDTSSGEVNTSPGDTEPTPTQVSTTTTGTPPTDSSSNFSLRITDAPLDHAAKVVIKFDAVELKMDNPSYSLLFEFDQPKSIDVLSLQGTKHEDLISDIEVESGTYNEIRLIVDDSNNNSFIELEDGSVHELKIPSGSTAGLKLSGDIIVPANRPGQFTIDFDARKSIVSAGPNYLLKPVIRLVDDSSIGHIRGSVDALLLTDASCSDSDVDSNNAVYVFAGSNITPDDIDQSNDQDIEPVTTTSVQYDMATDSYVFEAAYLEAGNYTLAITCNADLEDVESDQDLLFFDIQNVTVQVNSTVFL